MGDITTISGISPGNQSEDIKHTEELSNKLFTELDEVTEKRLRKRKLEISPGMQGTSASVLELPSKVTDREEIFMPLDIKQDDPRIYGKWLLFTNYDIELQDRFWIELQPLLPSGDIILLASSTGRKSRKRNYHGEWEFQQSSGVIKCYTCADKAVLQRAGIAIQSILNIDNLIYYKTNQASKDCIYSDSGNRSVSKYMLTVNGKLYEKDKLDRWKQVTDFSTENSVENEKSILFSSSSNSEEKKDSAPRAYMSLRGRKRQRARELRNRSGPELFPSQETIKKRYYHPKRASQKNSGVLWSLFCNVVDKDENGMTELDNIWKEVRNLCDEGVFTLVSCETSAFELYSSESNCGRAITCSLEDYCDIEEVIELSDKLRERTSFNLPMYLEVNHIQKMKSKYLYTEEGELYISRGGWKLLKR